MPLGLAGVRRYLGELLPDEQNIECWFGQPIVSDERAAVEWWAIWTRHGRELIYAGVTVLRFDNQRQVARHRDYDNHIERREPPYAGGRALCATGAGGDDEPGWRPVTGAGVASATSGR